MSNFAGVILLEIEMKIRVYIVVFFIVMAVMGSCKPPQASSRPSPEGEREAYRTLEEIDSLMWKRADSAFAILQAFVVGPMADSLDEFEEHYCQLLISELLYKNDYGQSNREALLKAVDYFDSLAVGKGETDTRRVSLRERNSFLEARAHYINGVGFYELGDVVSSCAEYLKALEVMEDCFEEKQLTGEKAHFMAYTYNRLGDMFSNQYMMEPAIKCFKKSCEFSTISPVSSYSISNAMYRIGIQYSMKKEIDSAYYYFSQALVNMPDSSTILYRDMVSSQILLSYQLTHQAEPSVLRLKQLIMQADNGVEKLARFLVIGDIYFEERYYDSSLYYLEPVFENHREDALQIEVANYLRIIYDSLGYGEKLEGIMRYLALHNEAGADDKAMVSKLENVLQNYLDQKQEVQAETERQKSIKKTVWIIVPVAVVVALAIFVMVKVRGKKLLLEQKAEADRVLGETEQRLKEVERKHQQWMAEAKERHAEELMAQRDRSEKEIAQTKERHAKELEAEREAYQKEREALRQILQSKEEQVRDLEMTLSQQQEEIVRRREAFLKEPVCKRINDLLHGRHITTRDTSYQHDDITLKEKDFKQLKEAVERHFEGFDAALLGRCPSLKHNDLTLCHLYLMGLSEGEIAALRSRTYSGIKKQNESLQEKLGLDEGVAAYVLRAAEDLCCTPTRSISQNSTLKGTLKSTWSDTLKGTQKKIVEIIINNPNVTIPQVAEQLDLNPRGIAKHFKALQEKGVIRRVGPDKGGHWEVIG